MVEKLLCSSRVSAPIPRVARGPPDSIGRRRGCGVRRKDRLGHRLYRYRIPSSDRRVPFLDHLFLHSPAPTTLTPLRAPVSRSLNSRRRGLAGEVGVVVRVHNETTPVVHTPVFRPGRQEGDGCGPVVGVPLHPDVTRTPPESPPPSTYHLGPLSGAPSSRTSSHPPRTETPRTGRGVGAS